MLSRVFLPLGALFCAASLTTANLSSANPAQADNPAPANPASANPGPVNPVPTSCFADNVDLEADPGSADLNGTAGFSLELFKNLFPTQKSENIFFSPYSIYSAFTLAYFGAQGETEAQLRKALAVKSKEDALRNWRALESLYSSRANGSQGYTFRLANRAYFDSSVKLNDCVTRALSSELRVRDMLHKSAEVTSEINGWVENVTENRIRDLVNQGDVANSRMALVNAAYFKGSWLSQFKRSATKKEIFYANRLNLTWVNMMSQTGNFRTGISEDLGAQILELPYEGKQLSMVILLPPFFSGENGFDSLVERLNPASLKQAMNRLWQTKVEVSIPKFKLDTVVEDGKLIEVMDKMGVKDLFTSRANLSDFSSAGPLPVSKAIHKAFVEVSEEGTEAAAASALLSFRVARPVGPSKFNCNHPFLFMVYDHDTNNILFMGAFKNPEGTQT